MLPSSWLFYCMLAFPTFFFTGQWAQPYILLVGLQCVNTCVYTCSSSKYSFPCVGGWDREGQWAGK